MVTYLEIILFNSFKHRIDVRDYFHWIQRFIVSPDWTTLLIEEELLKIPSDVVSMVWFVVELVWCTKFFLY